MEICFRKLPDQNFNQKKTLPEIVMISRPDYNIFTNIVWQSDLHQKKIQSCGWRNSKMNELNGLKELTNTDFPQAPLGLWGNSGDQDKAPSFEEFRSQGGW